MSVNELNRNSNRDNNRNTSVGEKLLPLIIGVLVKIILPIITAISLHPISIETANRLWEDRRKQIKRMKSNYKPGDLVLVKVFNRKKLDPFFHGPLKIVKKELNTVTVCNPITGEIADRNIHLKNIVPYFTGINLEED
ncbi:hypothetical protein PIROE2DRAFT_11973 [Piromyces sp. E2]|nr:hypothetical protein PIROE2DRAFT_11973 [Piromyces sp. E2]|eukprot:OUM61906.1 hypothetical protein PIROE2DRAFT_11973 [Piromyces sp. E2]